AAYEGLNHELWCCESSVDDRGFNLGGRLNLPAPGRDQILELVWYGSPRLIESVALPSFGHPYLKATRAPGFPTYSIGPLHVPEPYRATGGNKLWITDFERVARELESREPAMQELVDLLRGIGASEVCFCFKVSEGRLTVIDWDTEIESSAR